MKKKILALVLTLAMVLSLLPATALATEGVTEETQADTQVEQEAEGTPSTNPDDPDASETVIVPEGKAAIGQTIYDTVEKAVEAAQNGGTIQLGKGTYSGNTAKPTEQGEGAGKSLTFIGAGTGETTWQIQATKQYGSDGWCDYSFKGSDRITFENMTVIGSVYSDGSTKANDTQGLTYINHITLKDCIFNGRADYWGYQSTTFENVIFNAPGTEASGVTSGNYSLWTYTGKNYTFKNCTFNSQSGKTVNVYRHGGPDYDIIVNFEDCTFNTESHSPYFYPNPVNINDSTLKTEHKYVINFTGNMKTNGFSPIKLTCSRLFCFGADAKGTQNNTKKTVVNFNGTTVWQDGKMDDAKAYHNKGVTVDGVTYDNGVAGANDSLYAEGYKDNAVTTKTTTQGKRTVTTKTCNYCGWSEESSTYAWDVSRSKTAINLDSNYESKVTLSLPSAEENLATDVVLVLDASKCTKDMLQATIKLIENLEKQVELGANIKVGIVMFKGNAVPFRPLTKADDLKALCKTFTGLIREDDTETKAAVRAYVAQTYPEFMNGGTNVPSGLQLAKNMLEEDTSVTDARKYVVLVSDGDTYLFCHKNDKNSGYDYTKAYTRAGPEKGYIGGVSEYNNYDIGVPVRNKYFKAQNSLDANLWQDYLNYVGTHNQNFTQYDFQASAEALNNGNEFPDGFTDDLLIPSSVTDRIINSDVSRYQTASLYTELQDKYNCYYCFLPGGYDQARTMLQAFTPADRLIDGTTTGANIFSGITKEILYAVSAGSTVTDTIGEKFTFGGVDSFTLKVGAKEIKGVKDDSDVNTVNFGEKKNDGKYPYTVTYTPNTKTFVWTIN